MRRYIHRCHLRLGQFIGQSGQFLLDIASGPVQYDEYLTYSEGYQYRICADISMPALLQARQRIEKGKGIFILCDITNLPFQADVCDAFVSLHTVYHVAADQQLAALSELNRVLKPQKTGVVVYSWGIHAVLMSFFQPRLLWKNRRHIFSPRQYPLPQPKLSADSTFYFYGHSPCWFDDEVRPKFKVELASWRSMVAPVARRLVKPWFFGRLLLAFLFRLESLFPHFFGRYGQYPIFIFKK
jgi:ubiquinone/menaquinone biosynthesis C-methylase UbiE